ncbi:MAG: 23S rRNA (guanosine(2251)-2'-O)-methyltransferase RlmB [Limnochordales bacterium]|nr:23S rRNA (guanosine(2251)-2'-O)-methyltransferase RlmB [Limnochordales bacterium]
MDSGKQREEVIAGRRAVAEALRAGRPLHKLLLAWGVQEQSKSVQQLLAEAERRRVPVERVDRERLSQLAGTEHQGVVALAAVRPYHTLDDLMAALAERFASWRSRRGGQIQGEPFLLALDEIQDPRNLGALMRTAEAAGVDAVLITERRSAGLTPAAARAAAGAEEWLPVVRLPSLTYGLQQLQAAGLWVVGTAPDAPTTPYEVDLTVPLVVVVGNEGRGMRRSIAQLCDVVVRLPMLGRVGSLNASVAGGILLYEVLRQRAH